MIKPNITGIIYTNNNKLKGFTLIEMAVVLVIIGVILSTALSFYRGTVKTSEFAKINSLLEGVNQTLITFAMKNKRLPCADTNGNGYEGNSSAGCGTVTAYQTGAIPYKTLGMNQMASTQTDLLKKNIIYGVYRNSTNDADLTRKKERTGDTNTESQYYENNFDFVKALSNAINATTSASYIYTTDADPNENCSTNVEKNYAYILVSAGVEDSDNNGNVFDGVNTALSLNGTGAKCISSALKRKSNRYDDVVMVMNFQSLLGRLNTIN